MDLRSQKRFALGRTAIFGGRANDLSGMLECFNLFNHANYGSYVTTEDSVKTGQPQQSQLLAYGPRMLQLGFRLAFYTNAGPPDLKLPPRTATESPPSQLSITLA